MCGIFGYIGGDNKAIKNIVNGIKNLEHRGYDSMGAAFLINKNIEIYKISEEECPNFGVRDLNKKIGNLDRPSSLGIGHTRWATFGGKTTKNAHPHYDFSKEFYLCQNGNVENFEEMKKEIGSDEKFYSETDTEVIVNLIAKEFSQCNDIEEAIKITMGKLLGANAILMISKNHPDRIIAANKGSALLIGKCKGAIIIASDPIAFEPFNVSKDDRINLKTNEMAIIKKDGWIIKSLLDDNKEELTEVKDNNFNKHKYFMKKEIWEQPEALVNNSRGRLLADMGTAKLGGIDEIARELRNVETFHFIGCGTAYNAGCYGALLFNRFGIPARSWIASEFCYSHPVFKPRDAFIFISQSGETADTIEVLNEIKIKGNICLGLVNVVDSRIARETDAGTYIRAGRERSVASTKAFIVQLSTIVKIAIFLARQRKMTIDTGQAIIEELRLIPEKVSEILQQSDNIKKLAKKYSIFRNFYFLGRYFNSVVAQEGSLKLKEIAYRSEEHTSELQSH